MDFKEMKCATLHKPIPARGFTLVEVLVVVCILVVLAVVSFSSGKAMLTRARIIESTSNLRSLAVANVIYASDSGAFCPAADQFNNRRWHGARSSNGSKFDPTLGFLSPYLGKSMQVTQCPLFHVMLDGSSSFEDGSGGYGYNATYIGGRPGGEFDPKTKILISEKLSNIRNPSRTIMFTTAAYARVGGLQESAYCEPPYPDFGEGPAGQRLSPTVHFRANGKALVAWCDGSVTAESKTEVSAGDNPHGGDADLWNLGWCGPEANNGWWNPQN